MGTIIYKPHCGRCGAIINQKVTYRKITGGITKRYSYSGYLIGIEPSRCENCGEVFETIEIPVPEENDGNYD